MKERISRKFAEVMLLLLYVSLLAMAGGNMAHAEEEQKDFGVFVGIDPQNMDRMEGYHTVVIDAAEFSREEISALKKNGQIVYSYLNIGSIEKFRDYYDRFVDITLGEYENWPDERWVDVSKPEWQEFVTGTLAEGLKEKGVDGLFIDNADVYYVYQQYTIYEGLIEIFKGIHSRGIPVILNGGDTFLQEAMDRGDIGTNKRMIYGVNQETVFTSIDFDNETYGRQDADTTAYFTEYLERCKAQGLEIFLTEYGNDADILETIKEYCAGNGFHYYMAPSLALDGKNTP